MWKNYLISSVRNLLKHKGYSLLNVAGLTLGIAAFLMIALYIRYELSYDDYHRDADRIHRVAVEALIGNTEINQTFTSAPFYRSVATTIPEVETACRLFNRNQMLVRVKEKVNYENDIFLADTTFFSMFSFPLLHGDAGTALLEPDQGVITASLAEKYFGTIDVVGKTFTLDEDTDIVITGVMEDVPEHSHFLPQMVLSMATLGEFANNDQWMNNSFKLYVTLTHGAHPGHVEEQLNKILPGNLGEDFTSWLDRGNEWEFYLQPLTDIHLTSHLSGEFEPNSDIKYIYIFSLVALFVLLLAVVNFMNLATARSANRAKEIGLRKVIGSSRTQLIKQFMAESILVSAISTVLAIIAIEALLPSFNNYTGIDLATGYLTNGYVLPFLVLFTLVVGLLAGTYPGLYLSGFQPIRIMRGRLHEGTGTSWFRTGLVVFQFSISIVLITGTFLVSDQVQFMQNEKLGFTKDHVLIIEEALNIDDNLDAFKQELLTHPSIESVARTHTFPGRHLNNLGSTPEGMDMNITLNIISTEAEFDKVLGLTLNEGRFFSKEHSADTSSIVINQATVDLLDWTEPIGKRIRFDEHWMTVIGVVNNFHYESKTARVQPQAFLHLDGLDWFTRYQIAVRINRSAEPSGVLQHAEATWEQFAGDLPFKYSFFDEEYDQLYSNETTTANIFAVFSGLSIIIACLGLFGLASFMAERRSREIGIRKVLGASASGIVLLLSKDFTLRVLAANLVAIPAGYLMMQNWLEGFAYRTEISPWPFIIAAVTALTLALVTVSYQALKSALMNPAKSMQSE